MANQLSQERKRMNGYQRVMAVLRGELPDRVPVCLHNFLPAAREAGIPLELGYLRSAWATSKTSA